ncbi:MAG TPA: HlyD family efflux transporter periplasmic adaptor subunit, partial [Stellaceae bacterium]|nr:HlyD family efflux transporter periplasmic adaptor subunit [Stellaceae bacterium]
AVVAEWSEWWPAHVLCCPLVWGGRHLGMLFFARAEPWLDGDLQLIETLTASYTQSLTLAVLGDRLRPRRRWRPKRRAAIAAAIVLVILIGVMPIRASVLAPAEIVPVDPAPVRAPFDGVVGSLQVAPNQVVHAGQVLVSLDRDQLQARYAVAQKALDMAQAQYMVAAQQAMSSSKDSGQIAVLASKVDQQRAEVVYDKTMLDRAYLTAPIDGIAVFDDANQWIGKPVETGERIMLVASPKNTQLEIQVPAAEIVTFAKGSDVVFFNNVDPDRPTEGKLTFASYSSAMTADGVLAYAFRARLDPDKAGTLRLGLKGTAKIYGPRRPLALWLLRRPIAVMREWLSL